MIITAPEADLDSRVEALEADRENLYASVQMLDGECHDAVRRQKADRRLIVAIRTTQKEHDAILRGLVVGQEKMEGSQNRLLDRYVHMERDVATMKQVQARLAEDVSGLKQDVSGLKQGQQRLEQDVSGLKQGQQRLEQDVSGLKQGQQRLEQDVSGLKDGQARLEGKMDRFELLVRKGFGMESEN